MPRKKMAVALAACQLACLLATGCAAAGTSSAAGGPAREAQPLASESASQQEVAVSSQPEGTAGTTLRVALPAAQQVLGDLLQELAAPEGVQVEVELLSGEQGYAAEMVERYAGKTPAEKPDIFWVGGEGEARAFQENGIKPINFYSKKAAGLSMRALASLVPSGVRVLDAEKVYALPVGLVAEGTLVNIEQLTSLLGAKDTAALGRDLQHCTQEEWAELCTSLEKYLENPAKTTLTLAGRRYTMPLYRSGNAKRARGLYAMPTGRPASYVQNSLTAGFAAAYATPAELLDTPKETVVATMDQPLRAVFDQMDFETQHMTTADGPLRRGETFGKTALLSEEDAQKLFVNNQALLYKADTRTGHQLQQAHPDLQDKLVVVPTKLPLENKNVAVINKMLGYTSVGSLCVASKAPGRAAAISLLLRLFSSEEGVTGIEQRLGLCCFSNPNPRDSLHTQLMQALTIGETYALPTRQVSLSAAEAVMGEWTQSELMELDEWGEEQQNSFVAMAQGALETATYG